MTKKIFTLFVCLMLVLTMSIPAFAVSLSLRDFGNGHKYYDPQSRRVEFTLSSVGGNDGVIYVYSSGELANLSSSNLPLHMDYILPGVNSAAIAFEPGVIGYGKYTVLYINAIGSDSAEFIRYTDDELYRNKKNAVFEELKALTNPNGSAVKGILTKGDNFSVIESDGDLTDYNMLKDPDAVYSKMVGSIASLTTPDEMIALFVEKAAEQLKFEQDGGGSPENDNIDKGSSDIIFADRPSGGGGGGAPSTGPVTDTGANAGNNTDVINPVPDTGSAGSVFSDMRAHWAEKYASELSKKGIINGYGDGTFRGEKPITRAEIAKIINVAIGLISTGGKVYPDVNKDAWYFPHIDAVSASGIVTGFDDGTFRPDVNITRQDAAVMVHRAMSLKTDIPTGYTIFADELSISDYASSAVRALGDIGIITGDGKGAFNPQKQITRAELAALICRSLDYLDAH